MKLRPNLSLLVATLVLPLVMLLLGAWEVQRGADSLRDLGAQRAELASTVAAMQAQPKPVNGGINTDLLYRRGGQTYIGEMAIAEARNALSQLDVTLAIAQARRVLPPW